MKELEKKIRSLAHEPNRAVQVRGGQRFMPLDGDIWISRKNRRLGISYPWEKYRGKFGYAGPFRIIRIGLPIKECIRYLIGAYSNWTDEAIFKYGNSAIHVDASDESVLIYSKDYNLYIDSKKNIEKQLLSIAQQLQHLAGSAKGFIKKEKA
jgi:hypothetical protein